MFDKSRLVERIAAAVQESLERIGQELEDDIKQSVSTPYPPASEAYDPPHARSWTFHDSISHELRTVGVDLVLVLKSSDPKAPLLESGTWKMAARPSFGPALERARTRVLREVAEDTGLSL